MSKPSGWSAAMGSLFLAAALPGLASPIEHEVDPTGLAGAVPLAYGDHTINAGLSTGQEVDGYTFFGNAGDTLRFLIAGRTVGLDPTLVLRDPGGTVVNTTSCNAPFGGACSTVLDQVLGATGTYTLNVLDVGQDEAGSYQLHLEQYPPVDNWLGVHYATPAAEQLGHTTDLDFYAFFGRPGTQVQVAVSGLTVGVDPVLQVWAPDGTRIVDTFCNAPFGGACVVSMDLSLVADGTYTLGIWDNGWDETGNYRLTVSCLFGVCPVGAPPIPEPDRWALMLAGGAALLAWRRRR